MTTTLRSRRLAAAAIMLAAALGAGPGRAAGDLPAEARDDGAALGGYDVLIADRGNNRLLLVTPDKRILWQHDFTGLPHAAGADDAFFIDNGRRVIVSMEHSQVIEILDTVTGKVEWEYGEAGKPGSSPGHMNFPDDAYLLPNGNVAVADIRNCRILEISPDKQIVRQAGVTGRCGDRAPYLGAPNGDTPLPNGHMLVSTIHDHALVELDENWVEILRLVLPLHYPSDPQPTRSGNVLIADYAKPGRIIEIDRAGKILWDYAPEGADALNRPSLAVELPNGNILCNDDLNHRVIVIDRASKRIVWQYGVTGHHGSAAGYLRIPDGVDILGVETAAALFAQPAATSSTVLSAAEPPAPVAAPRRVGTVTRHAERYVGKVVRLTGFLLARAEGYVLFSDEAGGKISRYDLPVTGTGIEAMQPHRRYHIEGRLMDHGLEAQNGSPYHLELSAAPKEAGS